MASQEPTNPKPKTIPPMIKAILYEIPFFDGMPHFIAGDFNGDIEDFDAVMNLVQNLNWTNVGAAADTWGQPPNAPTCLTGHANEPTIRDHVLACPTAWPLITNRRVVPADLCLTHSTLQLQIQPHNATYWQYQCRTMRPLQELTTNHFRDVFGEPPQEVENHNILKENVTEPPEGREAFGAIALYL